MMMTSLTYSQQSVTHFCTGFITLVLCFTSSFAFPLQIIGHLFFTSSLILVHGPVYLSVQQLMRIEIKWKCTPLSISNWFALNICEVGTGGGLNESHIVLVKTCSLSSSILWVISFHVGRFVKRGPADGNGGSCCSNVMNLIPLAPPLPTHSHTHKTHKQYVALTLWLTIYVCSIYVLAVKQSLMLALIGDSSLDMEIITK